MYKNHKRQESHPPRAAYLPAEVSKMRDEYDFTGAEQGKFYRPIEELDIPIYLDKDVKEFFIRRMRGQGAKYSLNEVINALLKKDIEISEKLASP
jgi:hypothetical protein